MILKYKVDDSWKFTDGLSDVVITKVNVDSMVERYDREYRGRYEEGEDPCEYDDKKEKYSEFMSKVNKAFALVSNEYRSSDIGICDAVCLLKCFTPEASVYLIQAKYKDNKTYDSIMWLTNQTAFLLNDFGKTIERLI